MSGAWLVSYVVLWGVVAFQAVVIFLILRQLGQMYLGTAQGISRDGLAAGRTAPEFTVPDLLGGTISLAQFRGTPLLLVFGASDCKPCQGLIPDLNAFAEQYREQLNVLYLSRSEPDAARAFVAEHNVKVPVGVHPDMELSEQYQARVTPFAFLIDGEGIVRAKGLANGHEHLDMLLLMARRDSKDAVVPVVQNGASAEGVHAKEGHA